PARGGRRRSLPRLRPPPAGSARRASPSRADYPAAMTEFRLLGPLEVVDDAGADVPLPAGKPRGLLARLLLDAGRVVAVETLVEGLWPEPVPPSAYKVLQVHVSQLRKIVGPDRIETRPPGYVLRAVREEVARA